MVACSQITPPTLRICDAAHQKKKKGGGGDFAPVGLVSLRYRSNIQKMIKKTTRICEPSSIVKFECLNQS